MPQFYNIKNARIHQNGRRKRHSSRILRRLPHHRLRTNNLTIIESRTLFCSPSQIKPVMNGHRIRNQIGRRDTCCQCRRGPLLRMTK